MKVRWTTPALCNLETIGNFISRDNPIAARNVVVRILDQTASLAVHPHAGRPGRVPGTRELVVKDTPYIVPYRVRDDAVEGLAVFHGARQWPETSG